MNERDIVKGTLMYVLNLIETASAGSRLYNLEVAQALRGAHDGLARKAEEITDDVMKQLGLS